MEHALATLWIVVPCYNEQEVLPVTGPEFVAKLQELVTAGLVSETSRVLFVDDGSSDATWSLIQEACASQRMVEGMRLSRNRGHQNALLAGLMEARAHCDATISIDADGQDDLSAVDAMLREYYGGCDIVYGVRDNRATDSTFKRGSAELFYKAMGRLGVETVYNHADYRLMSARALDALSQYREVNLYLRGMVPLIGFKSTSVAYARKVRSAGESHYPLRKMLSLAANGVTSLSTKPMHIITGLGLAIALVSLAGIIWALVTTALGSTVAGWASTIIAVCFFGGVQMLCLGVIGEYVAKTYLETKARPRYIVAESSLRQQDAQDADAAS